MKKNVAVYARVSSAKQKEGENIQSQLSSLIEYANKHGYVIPNGWTYIDEGFSGATLQRPGLDALRELIHEGMADAVLIYSPDRLSRKYAYQLLLEIEFHKRGVEIIFFNTPKVNTPEEQMSVHFKGIFAEYERAQITERCRRGRLYRAKQGSVSVIPMAPFGYDYTKKTALTLPQYTINKDACVVKDIFNLYIQEHFPLSKICLELEMRNILSPRGCKKWNHSTVRDILKNECYIGTAHFGKSESSEGIRGRIRTIKGKKCSVPVSATKMRPKELWIPIRVPQIISENDFEMAQMKLEKNIKMSSRNTSNPSILQGLLVCGHCGSPYYKKARSLKYVYYSCSKRMNGGGCKAPSLKQEDLDGLVWNHVIDLLNNPQLIREEIDRRSCESQDSKKISEDLKRLDKDLVRINKAKDKLLDVYQDGECLTLDGLKERLKALNLKQAALQKEKTAIEKFTANEDRINTLQVNMERLQKQLKNSETLSIVDKQNVLRSLVSDIVITDQQVEIKHCIPCYDQGPREFGPLMSNGYISPSG